MTPAERYEEYLSFVRADAEESYEKEVTHLPNFPGETFEERHYGYIDRWMDEFALSFEDWCKQEGIKAF